jgi:WD40 repeat protein
MYQLRQFLSALKPARLDVLFGVLIGFGVGFWQWIQPPRPRVVIENVGLLSGWCLFSPDGSTFAIAKGGLRGANSLSLWDVVDGHKKSELLKDVMVMDAAFSPDGQMLACLSKQITIWNVAKGQQLASYPWEHWDSWLVFAADGKLLAAAKDDLWDVADHRVVKKLLLEGEEVISRGQNTLVVRSKSDVKLWNLAAGKICAQLKVELPQQWIGTESGRPELAPDSGYMIGQDFQKGSVLIFHLTKGERQEISTDTFPGMTGAAISPDGKTIALGIQRAAGQTSWWSEVRDWLGLQRAGLEVRVSAIPSGQEVISLTGFFPRPLFSPDGRTLAVTGANSSNLQLWELPIRKPIGKILGLAGLAAVATLLAFNGLGWLRRRRMRLNGNLVPSSVLSTK